MNNNNNAMDNNNTEPKLVLSGSVEIDKRYPECCSLITETHISESLGSPLTLPPTLTDKLSEQWANECEDDLLALFALIGGATYEQVARDNTYNVENDLSSFYVWTVYAPINCPDWCWHRDAFVVVEIGAGGDPRYCAYDRARIYRLDDACLGDTGFFDLTLGWWAEPIDSDRYDECDLDSLNDRITTGYASHPYYELRDLLIAEPVWSERRQAFLGRFKDCAFPVRLLPIAPAYG
jgi:hypothetical protein